MKTINMDSGNIDEAAATINIPKNNSKETRREPEEEKGIQMH